MCLHQFIRPQIYIPFKGVGDCRTCKQSPENKNCVRYYPINVLIVEVRKEVQNVSNQIGGSKTPPLKKVL